MKQYTSNDQTAKLIELGFEKPKGWYVDGVTNNINLYVNIDENPMMFNYSIGELIEMLPDEIYVDGNTYSKVIDKTDVCYYSWELEIYAVSISDVQEELIDNLYDMVIKLKEEGVI